MKLENLADLHNRRGNIGYVARRCQHELYPLLAWPEDKALLRLTDLPLIQGRAFNIPADWKIVRKTGKMELCNNDESLRDFIREGCAYYRQFQECNGLSSVVELEVQSK